MRRGGIAGSAPHGARDARATGRTTTNAATVRPLGQATRGAASAVVALAMATAACTGPTHHLAVDEPSSLQLDPRMLTGLTAADIAPDATGAATLTALRRQIRRSDGEARVSLTATAATLATHFALAGAVFDGQDPWRADWYRASVDALVAAAGDATPSPDGGDRATAIEAFVAGARLEHAPQLAAIARNASLTRPALPARDDLSVEADLLRLAVVWRSLPAWLRGDAAVDGVAAEWRDLPVDGGPRVDAGGEAAAEGVAATLAGVGALLSRLEAGTGHPAVTVVSAVVAEARGSVCGASVPFASAWEPFTDDRRVRPPRSFAAPDTAAAWAPEPAIRLFVVRTDGLYAAPPRRVWLDCDARRVDPVAAPWSEVAARGPLLAFEGIGALPVDALVDGALPSLAAALARYDAELDASPWLALTDRVASGVEVPASVVADAETYYSTLRPILRQLSRAGYGPLALHTLLGSDGTLDAVSVQLGADAAEGENLVVVRSDGYLLLRATSRTTAEPVAVRRTAARPLAETYRAIEQALATGLFDPARPLVVRVDDNTVDYGVLAHLLAAITFTRDVAPDADDRALLRAAILLDDAGLPTPLVPRGVRLAL